MSQNSQRYKRRWRYYQTSTGACPVQKFIDELSEEDAAAVHAAMKDVQNEGKQIAHHLRNDIYHVLCSSKGREYRILYSEEGKHNNILLALEGLPKKTKKVPNPVIDLAEKRLKDWRSRGQELSQ